MTVLRTVHADKDHNQAFVAVLVEKFCARSKLFPENSVPFSGGATSPISGKALAGKDDTSKALARRIAAI